MESNGPVHMATCAIDINGDLHFDTVTEVPCEFTFKHDLSSKSHISIHPFVIGLRYLINKYSCSSYEVNDPYFVFVVQTETIFNVGGRIVKIVVVYSDKAACHCYVFCFRI